ncbi:MAG TPA: phage major capsid protein [Vicinamibacteria bacterium]|nr:phage major capsid protein [Vicinamibacteria bacterium]
MNLKEQRRAAIKAAQDIIGKAQAAGRDLTTDERAVLARKNAEVVELSAKIERADAELFKAFEAGGDPGDGWAGRSGGALSFKGVAQKILHNEDGGTRNVKSLLAAGSQAVETEDVGLTVLKERPPVAFMESIPAKEVAENFSYLQQTVRTNNAAPVAVGALKPTSVFTLTRVEGRLKVVAHLSEPIPEYWLRDSTALEQFVRVEMVSGLAEAVAAQAINGDGIGENLAGISTTSGIQTQAFATDALTSIRKGITALETLSMVPFLVVMNPLSWEAIELTREGGATGGYLLGSQGQPLPIDRAKRQVWGIPVALSTSVPSGAAAPAYVLAEESVTLFHDGTVEVKWGLIGDDFGKNQVRCRAEGRFEMGVTRPAGVVKVTIAA